MYAGAWLEAGDAFDDRHDAAVRAHVSGVVLDTLLGPMVLAGSHGDGRWRAYVSIGRMFK